MARALPADTVSTRSELISRSSGRFLYSTRADTKVASSGSLATETQISTAAASDSSFQPMFWVTSPTALAPLRAGQSSPTAAGLRPDRPVPSECRPANSSIRCGAGRCTPKCAHDPFLAPRRRFRPCTSSPKAATEIRPVSSETTSERQSVSSVMPMAARWRVPSVARQRRIDGQRQKTGGRRDAVLLHDHRAIVQRPPG